MLGLHAVVHFDIAGSFPVTEQASWAHISQSSGLAENDAKRFVRFAMVDGIFKEPQKDLVVHTPTSKALANPLLRDCIWQICQEMWPAASRTVDALVKWPGSEEPTQTAFNLANNTDDPIFVELAKYPERARRFATAMTFFNRKPGFENKYVVEGYDWAAVGDGLLVDVGGSHGSLSQAILERFPAIRCVVQDRPDVIKSAQVPAAVADRLEFAAHDFFTKQPLSADVYLLRWILHNWSDKYAIEILRNLIPALKDGSKILVVEICLAEPGVLPASEERQARYGPYPPLLYLKLTSSIPGTSIWR